MRTIIDEKIGQSYSYWTILGFHKIDKHGDARWWCKCELCGNKYSIKGFTLRNGQSTKCSSCAKRKRLNGR